MASSGVEKKPSTRRVPDSLRRRTLVSCDRCKTRRIRCSRTNENESCTNCLNGGVKCESTLPRKHRVYGSVERLSLRYRALDALVRGLFPNEDTDDVEALFHLAKKHNISMPSPDDQSPAPEAFNHDQPASLGRPSAEVMGIHATNYEFPASEPVHERMVPGPHRTLHYVGPSSSSEFASILRHMVTRYKSATSASNPHGHERNDNKNQTELTDLTPPRAGDALTRMVPDGNSKQLFQANLPARKKLAQYHSISTTNNLRDLLPEKGLCDVLVQAYFENLHASFQIFYKPSFQLRYNAIWDNQLPQTGNLDVGWSCCLFMIIILGADILGSEQCSDSIILQTKYMKLIRDFFQRLTFTATLENIQALLLLQLYEHNSGERNTCWLILGLAARMAIALGMHREGTYSSFDTAESHTRRIVWWTFYQYEYNISIIFGRPPAIDTREVNVSLPLDEVLDGSGHPNDFAEHYLALTNIGHRIRRLVTTVTAKYTDEQALLSYHPHIKMILQDLETWKAQLPHHLTPQFPGLNLRHHRKVFILQVLYNHSRSVLTRPFLICKANRNMDSLCPGGNHATSAVESTTESLSRECRTSAIAVLDCLLQLSKYDLVDGVAWGDFYYVCHANLVLSLFALGQTRDRGQSLQDETSKSKVAEISDVFSKTKLAPTYKIFTKVTIDLAKSIGLGSERIHAVKEVQEEATEDPKAVPTSTGFAFTGAQYSQAPWSVTETTPATMFPPTTDNMLGPPGLLGWFHQEANTGSHTPWDMFNLGNIHLTGLEYMETPLQYSNIYSQQQQQQFEHWPGS